MARKSRSSSTAALFVFLKKHRLLATGDKKGFILGQLSVLVLLVVILKYLFLDSTRSPFEKSSFHQRVDSDPSLRNPRTLPDETEDAPSDRLPESAEWFNTLAHQVSETYRSKLRDNKPGIDGDEIARQKIENYANLILPPGFLNRVKIHSVDLGKSAPRLSNACIIRDTKSQAISRITFDLQYIDTVSLSLSTSYLFNYPKPSFARLPVSLTISLSLFASSITITPPFLASPAPALTISISPDFTLDLASTSLIGSRAKLANVPKLHELIQHQVRRILAARTIWKIPLPGLTEPKPD